MKQGSQGESARKKLLGALAVAWLAAALACLGGCGSDQSPEADDAEDGKPGSGTAENGAGQTDPSGKAKPSAASTEARRVLEAMVAAYQEAPSYADTGSVRLHAKRGEEVIDQKADFSVTFARPNKLRVHAYLAAAVCDGKQFWAFVKSLPGQVVSRPAPEKLTPEFLFADPVLANDLTRGFAGQCPQLLLLLLEDPLSEFLQGAQEPVLLGPEKIGEDVCDRVQIKRKEGTGVPWIDQKYGTAVFWIDQKSRVLRRIEFPVDRIAFELGGGQKLDEVWMVADFTAAQLGGQVDATAFAFEAPQDVKPQELFIPPDPRQLLGKPVPPFEFADLEGKPVTPASLGGRVTVLNFWGMRCKFCLDDLPGFEKVYQKYKDKVVFLGVNVDPADDFDNAALRKRFEGLGVTFPVVRDTQGQVIDLFMTDSVPASYLIGADGRVQEFRLGRNLNLEVDLPAKLDKLLAGQDVCQGEMEDYRRWLAGYKAGVEQRLQGKVPEGPLVREQEIPRVEIAPPTEPKKLKLTPLWKYADLKTPGNVLVAPRPDGTPRILVIDASRFHSVVELGPDGKLVATHTLPIKDQELIAVLTTAVGSDRKRYFTGTAIGQQRVHLFDEGFKPLVSYPEDALENRHAGIWDARLADLDGDGTLELYVGYWGAVGVQGATLDGRHTWSYRRIASVMRLAVGGPNPKGQRLLWCSHNRGTLVALDAGGNPQGELAVRDRPIHSIFAADLTGDGQPEWCGLLSVADVGRTVAIGLNLKGEELWTYEVPKGVHQLPVEPVIPGRLASSGPGQWLLPGPDGSIHVLGADGKLIDRFNYGAAIHGLATATLAGQPALIVATPNGVEAWRVE